MSEFVAELNEHPTFRMVAGIALLVLSCALLVALVATTGYQLASRIIPDIDVSKTEADTDTIPKTAIHIVPGAPRDTVAVLPFENLSTDLEGNLFASSVRQQIAEALSELTGIDAIVASATDNGSHSRRSVSGTASAKNARTMLSGTVRYEGGKVEINVKLTDTSTLATIWEYIFRGNALDIFDFRSEIVVGVTDSIGRPMSGEERERAAKAPTTSPAAYLDYAEAVALLRDGIGGAQSAGNQVVVQNLLDEALELDPNFADAYAWKAFVYSQSEDIPLRGDEADRDNSELMDHLAERNATMALERDPGLGIAHAVLAKVYLEDERLEDAQSHAVRALELSPSDPEVLAIYALVETDVQNRPSEAIPYLERAITLSPDDARLYAQLGSNMALTGRPQDAETAFTKCHMLDPGNGICDAGWPALDLHGHGQCPV